MRTLPHAPGLRVTLSAWCRFSRRNRPRRPPCAVLFRSWASPVMWAPKTSVPAGSGATGWNPAPRLTRTSVRSPAAHRRTRHLNDIRRACQACGAGDNGYAPLIFHAQRSCPQCLVRLGAFCVKPCRCWVCGRCKKTVVHRYSQQVHRLSTDLSFVDNFRPGVQSRSNNESHPVSGMRQGPGGRLTRGRRR